LNNHHKKNKVVKYVLGIILAALIAFVAINVHSLYKNETRQKLDFTVFGYWRLLGMIDSDIVKLEPAEDFQMPYLDDRTPYQALLADNSTVYIVIKNEDKAVSSILDTEYNLITGMIENGYA